MPNPTLVAALTRLDAMDQTLSALRMLAQSYVDEGDAGAHVAGCLQLTVSEAAKDLAVLAEKRESMAV